MCLLTSTLGVRLLGKDVNILTQIGFVVLVGLAAKNAILIVEFAQQRRGGGRSRAARRRWRPASCGCAPILMTSLAFILGVLAAGDRHRRGVGDAAGVGTAVFFGMIGVTVFGLLFTPVFYLAIRRLVGPKRSALREMARQAR